LKSALANLAAKGRLRVAGLMSGTSADGVDVAICDVRPGRADLLAFATVPYPRRVREAVFRLFDPAAGRIDDLCHLNFALGEVFADALLKTAARHGIALRTIDLVGSHGQTVCHLPQGRREGRRTVRSTLQIGEPSVIAERTGLVVVADFRPRDVAAGGQGAPLVPHADHFLFRHPRRTRAVQNIGGIANVTFLPAGGGLKDVRAFDTGPGNMVMDRLAWRASAGRLRFDRDGRMAAAGRADPRLLAALLAHPYFRRRPPKSTGREVFGAAYADRLYDRGRRAGLSPRDILATASALTAESIARAYRRFLPRMPGEVILCGGGARNAGLVGRLGRLLAPAEVKVMDEFGIPAKAKEAVSFAILAWATVRGRPANVPSATGARRPVVLGKVVAGR
jgi:anhydro-N-acetylmuramic acid kinase